MAQMPRAFDDQTRARNLTASEAIGLYSVSATYPHLQSPTTLPLYVPQQHNHFWPPDPLPQSHHDGSNLTNVTHPLYLLTPVGNEHSNRTRAMTFPKPSDIHNPSGSFHTSPSILSPVHDNASPIARRSTLDPTLHSNFSFEPSPWSTEDTQLGSVDGYFPVPTHHYHSAIPPQQYPSTSPHSPGDYILEPCSGMSDASYPCQWTENGIICNAMVQATRSHINRHLHTDHGFGGADTQQTRCSWVGCGETMQQGSIARHMLTCHLQAKVTCPMCFKKLSRQDVISKHQRVCPAAGAWR